MILVVSYPEEDHTVAVLARLAAAGREVALMDLGDFPASGMAVSYNGAERPTALVDSSAGRVDLERCRAGWWRRVRPYEADPAIIAPHERAFAVSETHQAVSGLLASLRCTWVNPPGLDEVAHYKPLQLTTARECGLTVPETLITNDPDAARAFITRVGLGRTVFKAFLASHDAWRETRLVRAEDLDLLDTVRFAPVIFQEYVPGVDLRVTIVGERLFAAEIDASATRYPFDMRMSLGEATVRPTVLPGSVERGLLALTARLGLRYGAADLRRDASGGHHFLEVNPAGQWLFAEERAGLPITDAVAGLLASLDTS
ncbi:MvdC/MvdD family ATP grasp protein [Streptosporangium sp. NPDC000396]|uniref:MvdC/MvdD family ATP grasp protein n=1 Tax=Streptosporangium sp. NPDC000396 TaxID=3366185 RepID=UPI0036A7D20C